MLPATLAHAHGPAPAITGVLAGSAQQPSLLALSEGLVALAAERSFVCPARFGLTQPPLAGRAPDGSAWLATRSGLLHWNGDAHALDERLTSAQVIDFAPGPSGLLVLSYGRSGSELLRVGEPEPAGPLLQSERPWLTVVFDGAQLWLARSDERQVEVMRLSPEGRALAQLTMTLPSVPLSLQLRSAAGRTFLHAALVEGARLFELATGGPRDVAAAPSTIFGPVQHEDQLLIGQGATLRSLPDSGRQELTLELPEAIHCLESQGGVAYLCLQARLFRLADVLALGAEAPPVFSLATLEPPTSATLGAADPQLCEQQWLTFQADLLRAGVVAEPTAQPQPDAGTNPELADAAELTPTLPDAQLAPVPPPASPVVSAPAAEPAGCSLPSPTRTRSGAMALGLLATALFLRRHTARGPIGPAQTARRQ